MRLIRSDRALLRAANTAQAGFRNVDDVHVSSDCSVLEVQEPPDGGYPAAGAGPSPTTACG